MRLLFVLLAAVLLVAGCSKHKKAHSSGQSSTVSPTTPAVAPTPLAPSRESVSPKYRDVARARVEETQVVLQLADGSRSIVPLSSLGETDRSWLEKVAEDHPLPRGKSTMVVVASTEEAKKTIVVSKTEGTLETVQLCSPNVSRDQIGGTCMIYARVHWLDIAGYYVDLGAIYKIINDTPPDHPWTNPRYVAGLTGILEGFKTKPVLHPIQAQDEPFDWARRELRKGRPILAALPREIWQALPSGFIAAHPWNGGSVGHQIVINGFTWDESTGKGSFHIVNSWAELPEFDLTTDNAKGGLLVMEQSLSPKGEAPEKVARESVEKITFIKSVGSTNLYEVQTNLGTRRVAAPDENAVYGLIEKGP